MIQERKGRRQTTFYNNTTHVRNTGRGTSQYHNTCARILQLGCIESPRFEAMTNHNFVGKRLATLVQATDCFPLQLNHHCQSQFGAMQAADRPVNGNRRHFDRCWLVVMPFFVLTLLLMAITINYNVVIEYMTTRTQLLTGTVKKAE